MNRDEIKVLLETLRVAYPSAPLTDKKLLVDMWYGYLKDYPSAAVFEAAKQHIANYRSFPTIAGIRERAEKVSALGLLPGLEAKMSEAEKIARANDNLPAFEDSGCVQMPCPYLQEGQTDFCSYCVFEGRKT